MQLYVNLLDSAQESNSHLTHFIEDDIAQDVEIPSLRLCFFRLCFNPSSALKDAYRAVEQAERRLVTTPLESP
jgi:hypothetical protein